MFIKEVKIRVRYGETDRMGYCYYGNYANYFEVARVEALRELGLSYKELEDSGVLLPVMDFNVVYHGPAYYDDVLVVKCMITEMPGVRIKFEYEVLNEKIELLTKGTTTLVFVNAETRKPCQPPAMFQEKLSGYFNN